MTEDRRHDPNPHPPPGISGRRCADQDCMAARNEWFLNELLPKLTIRFWSGILITIGACTGAFFFINKASINEHKLEALGYFVTNETYREDKRAMQSKLDLITNSQQGIIDRLDRIYNASTAGKK